MCDGNLFAFFLFWALVALILYESQEDPPSSEYEHATPPLPDPPELKETPCQDEE